MTKKVFRIINECANHSEVGLLFQGMLHIILSDFF